MMYPVRFSNSTIFCWFGLGSNNAQLFDNTLFQVVYQQEVVQARVRLRRASVRAKLGGLLQRVPLVACCPC